MFLCVLLSILNISIKKNKNFLEADMFAENNEIAKKSPPVVLKSLPTNFPIDELNKSNANLANYTNNSNFVSDFSG